jgi:hypothetical protein
MATSNTVGLEEDWYDDPLMDEDPGPDKPGPLLPPPPNPAAIGVPPPPQIGDYKLTQDGTEMVYTLTGWKQVPATDLTEWQDTEWTDFGSPKKILKGVHLNVDAPPGMKFKVSVDGEEVPFKFYPGSVTKSTEVFLGTALPYPWEAPPYSSKPAPPTPKKPAPEPMDLTSKRRIALNE